jgi:hypothetical protein
MSQNSINMGVTENADGGEIQLGIVKRILRWLGSTIVLTGSGSATITFPDTDASLLSTADDEFSGLDEKTTLHDDDLFVIEDSEDGGEKKKVKRSNVGGGGGREILSADRTYYVRTDGSDSNDGLSDSSGGAFLTAAKANQVVATIDKNGYNITVQFGAGTWNENIDMAYGIGDGKVRWKGTLSLLESVTSATCAVGSGATRGTVTKTGQFTGDNHAGKLVYFVTDNEYRIIYSNTNDALTLVSDAPSATTQNVEIYDWATIINRIEANRTNLEAEFLYFNRGSEAECFRVQALSSVVFHQCRFDEYMVISKGANAEFNDAFFYTNSASFQTVLMGVFDNASAVFRRCYWDANHTSNLCFQPQRAGNFLIFGGLIDGNAGGGNRADMGIRANVGCTGQLASLNGVGFRVINCDNGIYLDTGSVCIGSGNVSYSGNGTNSTAVSANFALLV